jgi:hypothetical protein
MGRCYIVDGYTLSHARRIFVSREVSTRWTGLVASPPHWKRLDRQGGSGLLSSILVMVAIRGR